MHVDIKKYSITNFKVVQIILFTISITKILHMGFTLHHEHANPDITFSLISHHILLFLTQIQPYIWLFKSFIAENYSQSNTGMEKDKKKLYKQGLSQNYFTQNSCVNYNKSKFATKQRKMYLTTTMSKIGPPDNQ